MSSWGVIGAVVGGVAGYFVGMPVQGASLGATIGGGIDSANTANANANEIRNAASYNATALIQVADQNAQAATAFNTYNSGLALSGAAFDNQIGSLLTNYNVYNITALTEFDNSLLEDKKDKILSKLEIDKQQYTDQVAQVRGQNIAYYGAAGVSLDEGTPQDTFLDMATQEAFQLEVMKYNADEEIGAINDAQLTNKLTARIKISDLIFSNASRSSARLLSTQASILGSTASTTIGNYLNQSQARVSAGISSRNSNFQAGQISRQGQQQLTQSLFTAGEKAYTYYGDYKDV